MLLGNNVGKQHWTTVLDYGIGKWHWKTDWKLCWRMALENGIGNLGCKLVLENSIKKGHWKMELENSIGK
jgi:hypothetical protein